MGLKIEHLVRIIREDETWLTLPRGEARELYEQLHAEFGPRLIVGLDMGDRRGDWQESLQIPITEPHAETGPTLQDDIERMVAEIGAQTGIHEVPHDVVPASGTVDPAEQERRGRINWDDHQLEATIDEPESLRELNLRYPIVAEPSNTPEPPAEPEPAPEVSVLANDRLTARKSPRTRETDSERAVRLWHSYRAKRPDELPNSAVGRVKSHLKHLTTERIRAILRENGIEVPPPQTHAQSAAQARFAQQKMRESESKLAPLIERFPAPPKPLAVLDGLALTFELLEEEHPRISSFYTSKCGEEALAAYKAAVQAVKPEYQAMPPFERRGFKALLGKRWGSGGVAA